MKEKALNIVKLALEKKAIDPLVLDVRKVSNFCDFFVILTGTSQTHLQAIADGIKQGMRAMGVLSHHKEGYNDARWIVLDYASVIVHIFDQETRMFYDLEHLWADAPAVKPRQKKAREKR
ncbi:MAG: ribosome silencing factor [Candidatus Omnitrophica bacterium]|nr:ribosome silencing factor [Candidatus Omnitrophota bacterium]